MNDIDQIIIRFLSGEITFPEKENLLSWLEQSDDNKLYFRSLKDAFDLGGFQSDITQSDVHSQWDKFYNSVYSRERPAWRRLTFSIVRYAAVFLIGISCIFLVDTQKDIPEIPKLSIIETGIGDRSKVNLPDGTVVWMNNCSSISYDNFYGKNERTVFLKGEAFFEVKTDSLMPFRVKTDLFSFCAKGTSFYVYSFEDEDVVNVALQEGNVVMEIGTDAKKISPGEMLSYNKSTTTLTRSKVDVAAISSWRKGYFIFDDMTFADLAKRLERTYNIKFVFNNENMKKKLFGGTLRDYDSLETIMKVICVSTPVRYKINKNTVYIN